jgi:hypothetical protein
MATGTATTTSGGKGNVSDPSEDDDDSVPPPAASKIKHQPTWRLAGGNDRDKNEKGGPERELPLENNQELKKQRLEGERDVSEGHGGGFALVQSVSRYGLWLWCRRWLQCLFQTHDKQVLTLKDIPTIEQQLLPIKG